MSSFAVKVVRINNIIPIEGADKIELAQVNGYMSVVRKGTFQKDQLVAYIPEASILPDSLIAEMGLTGALAGPDKNRVKAIRLRGQLSQGLIHDVGTLWAEGDDVTEFLGITKYEPPIPIEMSGQVTSEFKDYIIPYDIENIKAHPDVFQLGDPVVMTEKIHGTFMEVLWIHDTLVVTSKGLADKGLAFKDTPENQGNLYIRAAKKYKLDEILKMHPRHVTFGEVYGKGVQDLPYDLDDIGFRVFDLGFRELEYQQPGFHFRDALEVKSFCEGVGLEAVPLLYFGEFSQEVLDQHTSGKSSIANHMREGVVVKPQHEWQHPNLGRVILKSVSPEYLLRKGGTEFN
jgi:RNA ligase (TIGR02306 family)